jgi:hypothetical protein
MTLTASEPGNARAVLVPVTPLRLSGEVDSNSPAIWDRIAGVPRFFVVTSYNGRPSTADGRNLTRLGAAQPSSLEPWPGGGVWMEAVVADVDGTWYGYYHNEMPADGVCPGSNKVIPRIGAARSRDRGKTWEQLGIVLEAPAGAVQLQHDECVLRKWRGRLQRAARSGFARSVLLCIPVRTIDDAAGRCCGPSRVG